jgi:DNA-directed RNA polymerase specialized sigma subunit
MRPKYPYESGGFLAVLNWREKVIFDMIVIQKKTLEDVAEHFGVSRVKVMIAYKKATLKLKNANRLYIP